MVESRETLTGLLDGLITNPINTDRYLVLADLLEEMGDPLGDLIRLTIQAHSIPNLPAIWPPWNDAYNAIANTISSSASISLTDHPAPSVSWYNRDGQIETAYIRHRLFMQPPTEPGEPRELETSSAIKPITASRLPFPAQRAVILFLVSRLYHSKRNVGLSDPASRFRSEQLRGVLAALSSTIEGYREIDDLPLLLQHLEALADIPYKGPRDRTIIGWINRIREDLEPPTGDDLYLWRREICQNQQLCQRINDILDRLGG